MSPGLLSSSHRGGLTFQHGGGRGFGRHAPPSRSRTYFSPRQRFSVSPGEGGGTQIILDEDERVTVGVNEDGAVEIEVGKKPENANGNGNGVEVGKRRGLFGRRAALSQRQRLMVSENSDGSVTVTPTGTDNVLQVTGDPAMNQVVVTEIEPVENVPAEQ